MKKEIAFILVVLALILLGIGVAWGATGKEVVKTHNTDASLNPKSTLTFLRNLKWLRYLASKKNSTLDDESVPSSSENNPPRLLQKLRPNTPLSTAAETGHLVLATLHTSDAPGAVDRCMETGIELGMRTMDQALKDLVNGDMVSYETAVARVRNRTVFEKSLMSHS